MQDALTSLTAQRATKKKYNILPPRKKNKKKERKQKKEEEGENTNKGRESSVTSIARQKPKEIACSVET